jgi:CheY-like chemotaxis protein
MYFLNTAQIISLNNYHEKYSVHRCRNLSYWLVAGRFCLQRYRAHPHFIGSGRSLHFIIAHQKRRMTIIIIDDDQDFCMLFQQLLQKSGHRVYCEYTLVSGLQFIDDHQPDVIFLDNILPDGEGWLQADQLQKRYPSAQINLISAADRSFLRTQHVNQSIWEKPITKDQLDNYFSYLKTV